jgi:hypothetical protein
MLQDFVSDLEAKLEQWVGEFRQTLDFAKLEEALSERVHSLCAGLLEQLLNERLGEPEWLNELKRLGGRLGMRLKEYRWMIVRLGHGQRIRVRSAYFLKVGAKCGRKKRGPNGRGAHLGLDVLGFVGRCSAGLVSEVVQLAVLCPSFEVAHQVLARRGIALDVKTLRRLCGELGKKGLGHRGSISLSGTEELSGQTLVIGIDGGRVRERRAKRGRRKAAQKRQGYHAEWKEPKLFTIYLLDAQGQVVKDCAPWHDGTMEDHEGLFAVLDHYLQVLDLTALDKVVFCGDGAPWIWSGVEALCERYALPRERVYQVLDYTHAKQNLQEIVELLPARLKQAGRVAKRWKDLLWKGDLQGLYNSLGQVLTGRKKTQALKKWRDYFQRNALRMEYERFRQAAVPCGSGCVESAIRRVINLRLKAPGTFWTRAMAECFLFLRSQLLSGRWDILMRNVARLTCQLIEPLRGINHPHEPYELPQAA